MINDLVHMSYLNFTVVYKELARSHQRDNIMRSSPKVYWSETAMKLQVDYLDVGWFHGAVTSCETDEIWKQRRSLELIWKSPHILWRFFEWMEIPKTSEAALGAPKKCESVG